MPRKKVRMKRSREEIERMIERLAASRRKALDSEDFVYAHYYDSILEGLYWVLPAKTKEKIYKLIRELRSAKTDVVRNGDKWGSGPDLKSYDMMVEALLWALGSNVDLKKWAKEGI